MKDVTRILSSIEPGDPRAADELLPNVYDNIRRLAAEQLARESPGNTLQATALVHEAYLRLVDVDEASAGTAGATSTPRRPRPCAASSSRPRAGGAASGAEAP